MQANSFSHSLHGGLQLKKVDRHRTSSRDTLQMLSVTDGIARQVQSRRWLSHQDGPSRLALQQRRRARGTLGSGRAAPGSLRTMWHNVHVPQEADEQQIDLHGLEAHVAQRALEVREPVIELLVVGGVDVG